ncbi:hypothetical protein BXY51_002797 [Actinoplanes cyaneus]|nr:hypothetical protein [Actinoplanes cyaneus]
MIPRDVLAGPGFSRDARPRLALRGCEQASDTTVSTSRLLCGVCHGSGWW